MKVSAAFLTQVFSGKKSLPPDRFAEVCKFLDLDPYEKDNLKAILAGEQISQNYQIKSHAPAKGRAKGKAQNIFSDYKLELSRNSVCLKDWYYPAILDLATTQNFQSNSIWIAERLGIGRMQAEIAVKELLNSGHLVSENDQWIKASQKIRTSNPLGALEIRTFHIKNLEKAQAILSASASGPEELSTREISSLTVAVNPTHFEAARKIILEALHEAAEVLTQGECTEVYNFSVLLFPLTKASEKK